MDSISLSNVSRSCLTTEVKRTNVVLESESAYSLEERLKMYGFHSLHRITLLHELAGLICIAECPRSI